MDNYFWEYIDEGWIVIYMDDILIHVQTKEDLQEKMRKVLAKLKEHNLYLKLEKCKFVQEKVEFLGMIVTSVYRSGYDDRKITVTRPNR